MQHTWKCEEWTQRGMSFHKMHLIKKTLKKGMVAAIQIQDCISAKRRIAHQGRIVFLSTDFQLLATLGYFCICGYF